MCAEGNLTDIPLNSVYSGVVYLRGLRMCIFLAELNGLEEAYATDIENAYLEATTQEKVCVKAGPEFGNRAGHLLIIHKALCMDLGHQDVNLVIYSHPAERN